LGSCFSACPRNTTRGPTLQSGSFAKIAHRAIFYARPPQTVLLTEGLRSNPQNNRLIPKFSEAVKNQANYYNITKHFNSQREGKPEPRAHKCSYFKSGLAIASSAKPNGAKFWLDGSANKARVASVRPAKICHFRPLFLWFICLRRTRRINFINIF